MKKTGIGWRRFLTLFLAAALAGAAPAGALAASPESCCMFLQTMRIKGLTNGK